MANESRLLDALGEALVTADADLRVTGWNRSAERLFGWTFAEVRGQFVPRLVASNLVYESAFDVVRTVRAKKVWRGRLRLHHKDGKSVTVESAASAVYNDRGDCTGYVSIHRPQSSQSNEETAAIEKTGVLFQSCTDIVIVLDREGLIVAWNPAAERALKWQANETMYHPYEEVIQAVSDLGVVVSTVKQRGSWRGELTLCDRSGNELLFDSDITAVRDHSGRYLGIMTISRDITLSRRSEAARRRSDARLRALLSVIPDTFLRVGRDGRVQDLVANGPFRNLLGGAMPLPLNRSADTSGIEVPIRRGLSDLFPDVALRLMAAIEAAGAEKRVQHLTYRTVVGGQQSDLIFRVVMDAVGDALIIVQDVTELYKMERELSESEERFRHLVEQKQVGVYLMQDGKFQYTNPRFAEICGYEREEMLQLPSNLVIVHEEDRDLVSEYLRRRLSGEVLPPYSFRVKRKDGEIIDVEVYGALTVNRGRPTVLGTVLDITHRKRSEAALRESEERYRTLVEALHEGVMLVGVDGQILTYNDSAYRILGITPAQLGSFRYAILGWQVIGEDGRTLSLEEQPASITLRTGQPFSEVILGLCKPTGETTWLSVNTRPLFRDNGPLPYAIVVSFVDVTQRKHSQEDLQRQAFYDILTGLPNRALFMDRVERALRHARRAEQLVAVGYLDLDQFKSLNDHHGHFLGDLVLQQVAVRMCSCLREGDTVARMGGDEFTLLLPNVSGTAEAARVAERLLDVLRQPVVLPQGQFVSTVSLGLSIFPQNGASAAELLSKADEAMYNAKSAGKDTYRLYKAAEESSADSSPASD